MSLTMPTYLIPLISRPAYILVDHVYSSVEYNLDNFTSYLCTFVVMYCLNINLIWSLQKTSVSTTIFRPSEKNFLIAVSIFTSYKIFPSVLLCSMTSLFSKCKFANNNSK